MLKLKYNDNFISSIVDAFVKLGYQLFRDIQIERLPEVKKYDGTTFSLNNKKCVYRRGKITTDRPGAFLALWKRPHASAEIHKPIPLTQKDIDYLFIKVEEHTVIEQNNSLTDNLEEGMFIFPASLLIQKGIIASVKHKGKTGFRVFPPWSGDRGNIATKVFSESGKKTQAWQLPYFIAINNDGEFDSTLLNQILSGSE